MSASAQDLAEVANKLQELMRRFKILLGFPNYKNIELKKVDENGIISIRRIVRSTYYNLYQIRKLIKDGD